MRRTAQIEAADVDRPQRRIVVAGRYVQHQRGQLAAGLRRKQTPDRRADPHPALPEACISAHTVHVRGGTPETIHLRRGKTISETWLPSDLVVSQKRARKIAKSLVMVLEKVAGDLRSVTGLRSACVGLAPNDGPARVRFLHFPAACVM